MSKSILKEGSAVENYKRAKTLDLVKYGFGGLGSNLPFMMTMMWLTYFYTDIFMISPIAIGGIMLTARIIDAITDPLMGMISDRTKSKFGRYRPWVIFLAPVLGLFIFLIFRAPELSPTMKMIYAYVTYILYSVISTMVNIPYHSLTPVMTEDPDQRTIAVIAKQAMTIPAQLIVAVLAMPIVKALGGGAQAWAIYAAFCGVLSTVSFWICANGAKKYDKMEMVKDNPKIKLSKQLKLIYKNKPLLMLMIAFGTDLIAATAASAVNAYYFIYCLNRGDMIAVVAFLGMFAGIIPFFFIPFTVKKLGKKKAYIWGTALSMVPLLILFFVPYTSITLIIILLTVYAFFARIPGNLGWSMLPDCVEYGEFKFGIRGEGTVTSALTFINKFGMAIGGGITGIVLGIVGYQAGAAQTGEVLTAISGMKFLFPVAGYICSLISMSFYPITNDYYKMMRTKIKEKQNK